MNQPMMKDALDALDKLVRCFSNINWTSEIDNHQQALQLRNIVALALAQQSDGVSKAHLFVPHY